MEKIINTYYETSLPNVVLTDFEDSDAELMTEYLQNMKIHNSLRYLPNPYTKEDAKEFINFTRELKQKNGRAIIFAVRNKETKELIGSIGFDSVDFSNPESPAYKADIGYWLGEKYWGKGIGSAAVKTLCHIAFDVYNLDRIQAAIFEENIKSEKVLLKNGFTYEGLLRNYYKKGNKLINAKLHSKIKSN